MSFNQGGLFRTALLVATAVGIIHSINQHSRLETKTEIDDRKTLIDSTGHPVKLPEQVTRVGTPGISMASLIMALSGPQTLIAASPDVRDNSWLSRIFPTARRLPVPFSHPSGVNVEELLSVRPELVTLWNNNANIEAPLSNAGIRFLHLGYATPHELKKAVRLLASALGETERRRGEEFILYYDRNLERVNEALKDLPERQKPRIYYASLSPLQTEGRDSMIDAWITTSGGRNVASEAGIRRDAHISIEDLLNWDPELIVTLSHHVHDAILADSRLRNITAVQRGQVIVNPKGINAWCTRAAEAALQILWAAKLFHPERTTNLNLNQETRYFYQLFYHYDLDDDELARILQGAPPPTTTKHAKAP